MKNQTIIAVGLIAGLSACGPSTSSIPIKEDPVLSAFGEFDVEISDKGDKLKVTATGDSSSTVLNFLKGDPATVDLSRELGDYANASPTGEANSTGDYFAVFVDPTGANQRVITGNANINVDFDAGTNGTVSGDITNRVFRFPIPSDSGDAVGDIDTANTLSDVQLPTGNLNGVLLSNVITGVSGGEITDGQNDWNATTDGGYITWVAGTAGTEFVGSVGLTHNEVSGDVYKETGAFITTTTP